MYFFTTMRILFTIFFVINVAFKAQLPRVTGNFSYKPPTISTHLYDNSEQIFFYKVSFLNNKKLDRRVEAITVLQIGKNYTRFSDYNNIKRDSLTFTFSKKESVGATELGEYLAYTEKWKNILLKDRQTKKNIYQDKAKDTYQYEENEVHLSWKLQSEKKKILVYDCFKATTEYRGRRYTAWYSPDLPFNEGPYVFGGLPGLVMEVEDDKKEYQFLLIGIEKKEMPIYLRNDKEILNVTRKQFRDVQRNYHENPGFFHATAYDLNGNAIVEKGKSLPYNPIEKE